MEYPKFIYYKDVKIPINWDFRVGIAFEKLIYEHGIDEQERFVKFLELYFNALPKIDDPESLVNEVLKFYRCGKEAVIKDEYENKPRPRQAFDYEEDWPYIQAAFLQQYQMDLNRIENLHWWQFKGMLESLNEDTQFKKILGFRLMKIDKNMSKEQKAYYNEMKKIYKLPDKRTQEEIDEEFANAFW